MKRAQQCNAAAAAISDCATGQRINANYEISDFAIRQL